MMAADYWEATAYASPPLSELERCDESAAFAWIAQRLPVRGSKIDWARVPGMHSTGMHSRWHVGETQSFAALAPREIGRRITSDVRAMHVGDGLSPYGVYVEARNAIDVIDALLQIPEHHYFLAEDHSWLAVVTTEGDFDLVELC